MNKIIAYSFIIFVFWGMESGQSYAQEAYSFGPKETKIEGSIHYSLIGKYKAQFKKFSGKIVFDDHLKEVHSVDLEIVARSITSNCPLCDRVVKSRKLLDTAKYPLVIFKSDKIIHDKNGYMVKGVLNMHGITRPEVFPFFVKNAYDQKFKRKFFKLQGSWIINRKEFNIIWSKLLDRGGILVGDNFTVSWEINIGLTKAGQG